MQVFIVPFQRKYLIYRPLLHLAFLGNRAMANLVTHCAGERKKVVKEEDRNGYAFLQSIGFFRPDPPPSTPQSAFEPKTAVLLMTNRCNLRCTYCYAAAGERIPQDLSLSLAKQAIDIVSANAKKAGMESFDVVFHGGGEPTQHWTVLTETIRHARRKPVNCKISMSSNGVWSDMQRKFILENFDGLSLSFDAPRELQEAQRLTAGGKSSFNAVMKSIRIMDQKKFPYNIRITLSSKWLEKLPESVHFICEETGCRYIQVEPAFNPGRSGWKNPKREESDRFIAAFQAGLDVAENYRADLMYAGARPWMTVCSFCNAGDAALIVRSDGMLTACYEITDSSHPLNDYFTIGRLTPDGSKLDQASKKRLSRMKNDRLKRCKDCFCVWHCAGDCSTRCFSADGTAHLRFEERCRINREITKDLLARFILRGGGIWCPSPAQCSPQPNSSCDQCKKSNFQQAMTTEKIIRENIPLC